MHMKNAFGLKEIDAFVTVIDLGGFRPAARELRITQSALTQRLKKLEDAVGARLIDRTTRTLAPTAVGLAFLPAARRLRTQFERSVSDLHDVVAARGGIVTVASLISVATYVLPGAIRRFSAQSPAVRVRVLDDAEQEIAEHVRRGEAEFALDMRTAGTDPDLMATPLLEDRFVLACRHDHPLSTLETVAWEALAEVPLVVLGRRSGSSRLLASGLPAATTAWLCEVQHLSTMLAFIEAGLGVGIVPGMAMPAVSGRSIVARPISGPAFIRSIVLIERRGATLSPAAQRLKALVREEFAAIASR